MKFNSAMRTRREAANLTQTEVAREMKVDQTAVSQWESGDSMPRADKLPILAALYNCSIDDLFQTDDPTDQTA